MKFWLKYSFLLDLAGGLGCIAYGIYTNNPWWWGGGLAGLVFSVVWKKVQPKLLGKFMRKAPAAAAPVISFDAENPLATSSPSLTEMSPDIPVAPKELTPEQKFHLALNTFPAVIPRDGRIRFY